MTANLSTSAVVSSLDRWTITIPGEPVPAPRPRANPRGRGVHMPTGYMRAKRAIALAMRSQGRPSWVGVDVPLMMIIRCVHERPQYMRPRSLSDGTMSGPEVERWAEIHGVDASAVEREIPAVRNPCDTDNLAKTSMDAATDAGVILDDHNVCSLVVTKHWAAMGARARTEIVILRWWDAGPLLDQFLAGI